MPPSLLGGSPRRAIKPSMLRRCFNWDYRQPGTYLITLTLADRSREWLGVLKTREQAREHGGPLAPPSLLGGFHGGGLAPPSLLGGFSLVAFIELTALGEIVARIWREIGEIWPGVEPRELQIMPEHLHGILRVTTPQKHPLGQIIGGFKAKTTAAARELLALGGETREQAREHGGALAPPSLLGGFHGGPLAPPSLLGGSLWSPGLHDAILWDLGRYRKELAYLLDNPRRLAVKRAHPDLFRVRREITVALPGADGALARFAALGNIFLLDRPLFQIQVSRRDFAYRRKPKESGSGLEICRDSAGEPLVERSSPAFQRRLEAALQVGAGGQVLLSPCVSDGERQIARAALAANLPLVAMKNKGFSSLEKPAGRLFDACAEGRLLLLAPAAWPWQPGQKPMTREDATAMNRLCQWLAGEAAATVNYHGMEPTNIDTLAERAAALRQNVS